MKRANLTAVGQKNGLPSNTFNAKASHSERQYAVTTSSIMAFVQARQLEAAPPDYRL